MVKQDDRPYKVILGLALTTAIGAGLLCYVKASRHRPTPVLHKIGRTISEVGEMLENCELASGKELTHQVENSAQDLLSNMMSWTSTGIKLWNNLKKGR